MLLNADISLCLSDTLIKTCLLTYLLVDCGVAFAARRGDAAKTVNMVQIITVTNRPFAQKSFKWMNLTVQQQFSTCFMRPRVL